MPCGACGSDAAIERNARQAEVIKATVLSEPPDGPTIKEEPLEPKQPRRAVGRIVFRYSKSGPAAYMQHLSIIDAFDRAFLMADLDVAYSEGFNPMPRFETAQPIPIAVESHCEVASLLVCSALRPEAFIDAIKDSLPQGLCVEEAVYFHLREGKKQRTIGSLEWGSVYSLRVPEGESLASLEVSIRAILEERAVLEYRLEQAKDEASRQQRAGTHARPRGCHG
jgi:radical SAM-linked protein